MRLAVAVLALALPAQALGDELAGFKAVDVANHEPKRAASLMALVEPLYRNHPESLEGRATLKVDMKRLDDRRYMIEIEMGGLLDDSIEGRQYRAVIGRSDGEWDLQALGERWRCARGLLGMAGAWTTRPCS